MALLCQDSVFMEGHGYGFNAGICNWWAGCLEVWGMAIWLDPDMAALIRLHCQSTGMWMACNSKDWLNAAVSKRRLFVVCIFTGLKIKFHHTMDHRCVTSLHFYVGSHGFWINRINRNGQIVLPVVTFLSTQWKLWFHCTPTIQQTLSSIIKSISIQDGCQDGLFY